MSQLQTRQNNFSSRIKIGREEISKTIRKLTKKLWRRSQHLIAWVSATFSLGEHFPAEVTNRQVFTFLRERRVWVCPGYLKVSFH